MEFLTEPPPPRGVLLPVRPGIGRVVAGNPGPMTYHGTNTWLIDTPSGTIVIDPGPDDPAHRRAVLAAAPRGIARILLTHAHRDHADGLPALRDASGAEAIGFAGTDGHAGADPRLADGDAIDGLTALHTPGHASDHLCFAAADRDGGRVLFSGDHVMGWSTSVVSPPEGDMVAYLANLRRLLARDEAIYLPGHGPPIAAPRRWVADLIAHRLHREAALREALREGPADVDRLTARLYPGLSAELSRAAARSVLAHLLKLEAEGRAHAEGEFWVADA